MTFWISSGSSLTHSRLTNASLVEPYFSFVLPPSGLTFDGKNTASLHCIVALCIAVAVAACSTLSPHNSQSVVGTWVNPAGTVWALKADGKFEARVKAAYPFQTWGTYTVSSDTLTIHDESPKTPKPCHAPGVYQFQRSGDSLRFTLVEDRCVLLAQQVPLGWHLQQKR